MPPLRANLEQGLKDRVEIRMESNYILQVFGDKYQRFVTKKVSRFVVQNQQIFGLCLKGRCCFIASLFSLGTELALRENWRGKKQHRLLSISHGE